MIKKWWGKITRKGSEEGEYPIQQATYLGRISDFFVLFPYGMHANLPVDQLGLLIDREGRILMGTSAVGRITVEEGEVVFYHPKTKSKTHYKNNGDIDIDTIAEKQGNLNINTKNAIITASENVVVNAAGDVTVDAATATVTAPTTDIVASAACNITSPITTIDGLLVVTGLATTAGITITGGSAADMGSGAVTSTGSVTVNGISVENHGHPYTWTDPAGSGTSSDPV